MRAAWILAAVAITLAGLALRLWNLDRTPPGFHFDESFEGLEAWRILTEPAYRPIFLRGNFGVPVAFAYLSATMFRVFQQIGLDAGPLAMRTVAALAGTLSIPVLMGLARELVYHGLIPARRGNGAVAAILGAGATLAGLRWHIHFSRMGIEPVLGPLIWAGGLWLLLYALRRAGDHAKQLPPMPALASFLGAGALAALALYTYQAIWILPIIFATAAGIIVVATWRAAGMIQIRTQTLGLLLAGGVALLLVLPLLALFWREPALLTTRPTQVIAGAGNVQTLPESIIATAGMFVPFGAGDLDPRRNIPGAPALNWIWGCLFLVGVGVGLRHMRRPAWLIIWISWLGLLLPGVVTEYAPHFHRILAAAGPTALITGVGFWQLGAWLRAILLRLWPARLAQRTRRVTVGALLATLVITATAADVHAYFQRWSPRPDLYHAFDAGFWAVGQWTAQQLADTPQARVFISPRGLEHTTLAFALRRNPPGQQPITYDGRHVLAFANNPTHDALYISIQHEDFRTGLLLPDLFPNIQIEREFLDRAGNVYATAYRRAASMTPARPPQQPLSHLFGDGIALTGYDLLPANPTPGDIAYLQLHWQTDAAPTQDWTVYIHVLDPATQAIVAQHDAQPGQGSLPTRRWQADWTILDEHQLQLPPDLPPGDYPMLVGMYPTRAPGSDAVSDATDSDAPDPVVIGLLPLAESSPANE